MDEILSFLSSRGHSCFFPSRAPGHLITLHPPKKSPQRLYPPPLPRTPPPRATLAGTTSPCTALGQSVGAGLRDLDSLGQLWGLVPVVCSGTDSPNLGCKGVTRPWMPGVGEAPGEVGQGN